MNGGIQLVIGCFGIFSMLAAHVHAALYGLQFFMLPGRVDDQTKVKYKQKSKPVVWLRVSRLCIKMNLSGVHRLIIAIEMGE